MAPRSRTPTGGSREEAELLREMLGAFAHELGGLSGALGLRADALRERVTAGDQAALHAIAGRMREIGRALRLVRGPAGANLLAPASAARLPVWWRLIEPLVVAAAPRGVAVQSELVDVELAPRTTHALTHFVLAFIRDLADRGLAPPATILVVAAARGGPGTAVSLSVRAERPDGGPVELDDRATRWARHARRVGERAGMRVTLDRVVATCVASAAADRL